MFATKCSISHSLFILFQIILKKDHSFHKNIKQHNCFQHDNKKCLLSNKSAYV